MSVVGSRQKARVFLEGREIPFQAATIDSNVGVPTTAVISLVPLKGIKNIKPRTQVHIFLQDTKNFPDNDFYLVFEGEVLGRGYGKAQDNRHMSISCIDYSSYWDLAKTYVLSPNFVLGKIADVIGLQEAPINQTVKALAGTTTTTSATGNTRIIEILLSPIAPSKVANKDLVKGVVQVIKKLAGASQFFGAAFERMRINDRINIFSSGKITTFLADLKIEEWLSDYTGKFGGISDIRKLLYSIMNLIFHDFVSIPFPAKLPNPADKKKSVISQFYFVPDGYSLPAPMCNVIFPNQQISSQFDEDFRMAPTRYSFRASFPLMAAQGITYPQYPNQFYPTAFSDYMFGKHTATATETASMLGPSTLLTDPKGNTYAKAFYGKPSSTAVGTAFGNVLRESDFMTNEESLKGIYLDMDTFMPSYTALVKNASAAARKTYIQGIGSYLFYKKRFSSRSVSAELIFNPFLVPGFNAIFLDESDAGQSFIAKIEGVTHMLRNDGCATQVKLAYGRDFDEVDALTGGMGDPPVPPWFDPSIFGKTDAGIFKQETDYLYKLGAIDATEKATRDKIQNPTVFPDLNKFYQALFGCNSITNFNAQAGLNPKKTPPLPKLASIRGAVSWLLHQYKTVATSPDSRDAKVQSLIQRPLINIMDTFAFIGATPAGFSSNGRFVLPDEFAAFTASLTGTPLGRFDGGGFGKTYPDKNAITLRRSIIDEYVAALKQQRGFRG